MRSAHLPVHHGRAIRTAFRLLVEAVGGLEAAAAVTGASPQLLALHYAPDGDRWPRLDHVADLEAVAGKPLVTAVLARLVGHSLVALPGPGDACRVAAVAGTLSAGANVASTFADVIADGAITDREADRLAATVAALVTEAKAAAAVLGRARDVAE